MRQPLGHLSWGTDPKTNRPWTPAGLQAAMATNPALARDVPAMLKRAAQTVGQPLPPLKRIYSEGLLASDPRKIETGKTLKRFDDVAAWGFAARMAPSPLKEQCQQRITQTLLAWSKTYVPTGNPINENRFLSFFQAADQALPTTTADQQAKVRGWIKSFVTTSEHVHLAGLCDINNWRTFNLQIRATGAAVIGDQAAMKRASAALDSVLKRTIAANGESFDFRHRDALHYHVYNLSALLNLASLTPQVLTTDAKRRIEHAVTFMKPYYLGTKKHLEFQHTQVAFDIERRNAGEPAYQVHRWDPREADDVLQLARAVFPSVRGWTAKAEADGMGARQELMATLRWPARP
ncbi:MAG: alginate lyase family protein [Myxococcaceae bacterium]